jgi:corrinoid protein of di/trimethylamine methyltransferase
MGILEEISSLMQQGRAPKVKELVQQAIDEGVSPKEILEKGLLGAMSIIGDKFKKNEIFVPEVLIAARAMNAGVSILKPYLVEAGVESKGTAVIGTVKGDLHDIGKNLVKMMLEGKGLNVIDLGVDVPAEDFVKAAQENNADIICCSALLTTTMGEMKNVVAAAAAAGIRDKVKIMVGGAPITQSFCDSIGADSYSPDAASAADAALALCN